MTVFDMAKKFMSDKEFLCGGIPENERKWADKVGFPYTVDKDGVICCGEDMSKFWEAMATLYTLNRKYGGRYGKNCF